MASIATGTKDPGYEIADGIPHMTYQNPAYDINFVWDGVPEHPIMVCPRGYGEPVNDLIEVSNETWASNSPAHHLMSFAFKCEEYLNGLDWGIRQYYRVSAT